MENKKCLICGKEMPDVVGRHEKIVCGYKCAGLYKRLKYGRQYETRTCPHCGKEFQADKAQTKHGYYKFCSNKCRLEYHRGEKATRYKGGWVRPDGYRQILYRGRPKLEHDVIWFLATGIWPDRQHHVHHIDGNKLNNNLSNLKLLSVKEHQMFHPQSERSKRLNSRFHKDFVKTRNRDESGRFI